MIKLDKTNGNLESAKIAVKLLNCLEKEMSKLEKKYIIDQTAHDSTALTAFSIAVAGIMGQLVEKESQESLLKVLFKEIKFLTSSYNDFSENKKK